MRVGPRGFTSCRLSRLASSSGRRFHRNRNPSSPPGFPILPAVPQATALYLFPTKALAQDQLKGLTRLAAGHPDLLRALSPGVYDGDTQAATRRKVRDSANLILSNPDMLHQGILPAHARWARFLRHLRFVVVDEMHAYRGIFGSHVANVLRRLERIVRHVG